MKIHMLMIVGFALGMSGCAEREQAASEAADEAPAPQPAAEAPAPEPVVETPPAETPEWMNDAFLEHMHRHAGEVDEVNLALADGDLDTAQKSAVWLARHDPVTGIPAEWLVYLDGMREAARAVAEAADVDAARLPAESITDNCQSCHIAAGIVSH